MLTADQLSHQMLRDLSWVFSSPSLIQTNQLSFQVDPPDEEWLTEIARAPDKISQFMVDKNLKMLGPYFEALWEFYLLNNPAKKLIAKNIQVFSDDITIGEFDFIYLDNASGEVRHLEVAIKYFLGFSDHDQEVVKINEVEACTQVEKINEKKNSINHFSPMDQWLGPNANDRFDKKYFKMLNQQSLLSQTPGGKSTLDALGVLKSAQKIESEICLLGYFFYPLAREEGRDAMLPPENSHPNHNRAYWLRVSQLEIFLPKENFWKIMDKPFWLAPLLATYQQLKTRTKIFFAIQQHFIESQRPLLISNFIETNKKNGVDNDSFYYESDKKYFVVPDNWPVKIKSI